MMTKILVVDDDIQATELINKILTLKGFEATVVNVSSETIKVAKATSPDLILLDLMMPEPDGFKVCRMLRVEPEFAFTPIIIITALDDTDSKIVAFGAGATDYMIKPLIMDTLIGTIKSTLGDYD